MDKLKGQVGIMKEDLAHVILSSAGFRETMMGRTILLTGGTGFFGKWILESILFATRETGLQGKVFVLSRDPASFKARFPHLCPQPYVHLLKGDVARFEFPQIHVDYIIHAATEASARLTVEEPLVMIDSIINGTRNILEFARKQEVKRMLYISSGAVYGIQPAGMKGFPEDFSGGPDPLSPASAYAEAKRTAELLCACYSKLYGIGIPVARCFAFVGPYINLDIHFAIGNFIRNGLNGEPIVIRGDGKPLRSYMYAADLVTWLFHILVNGKSAEAYNVGSDEAISIKELAFKVASFFPGLKVDILNQVRSTDRNQDYVPDISKIRRAFALNQTISLDQAIERTIGFYRQEV